ncbi:MAG: hypothetical protein WCC84_09565 [Candidatus Cybelea sp.]
MKRISRSAMALTTSRTTTVKGFLVVSAQTGRVGQELKPGTKGDRIDVYSPRGKQLLRTISRYVRAPHAIAFDSHENLYVVNGSAEYHYLRPFISVYKPGANSPFRRITIGRMKRPVLIAIDKADNVFVNAGSDGMMESINADLFGLAARAYSPMAAPIAAR